jgi:hypothetical protein
MVLAKKKDVTTMKNLIKTLFLPLLVAGLVLSACAEPASELRSSSSDPLIDIAPTISALAQKSQLIVIGTVTGTGETWNIARGADPMTPSTTSIVLAQNFVLTVDATLKGTAGSQVTWAVAKGRGSEPFPPTLDANWTPPTMGTRYLLFLVKIPGTEIYGIPAEPSRFRLDASNAQAESKYPVVAERYPTRSIASVLDEVRSAVGRP